MAKKKASKKRKGAQHMMPDGSMMKGKKHPMKGKKY